MILPLTSVGSFPKPDYVKGSRGRLDDNSRRATEDFIRRQEEMGFDVLADGEFYRGDMATDYARALGLPVPEEGGWTRSYDNRFWRRGTVDRPLERPGPMQVEQYKYAQSLASRPVKGMLTGPTTLANWNFDNYYGNREDLVFAWADVIRQEALALQEAGAQYIQIDEAAIGERFWEVHDGLSREALERVTQGLHAYTIAHVCYGEFDLIYPYLKYLPVNQIDIELSVDLDLGLKRSRLLQMMKDDPLTRYKDVAVGVIDIRPDIQVEDRDTVRRRIETAIDILGKGIWVKPDCGFRTTKDIYVSYGKMGVMSNVVRQLREELQST